MSNTSTDKLAKLIAQRRQCLMQMRDLGRKQAELIATGDMGALLRLLSAKQQLITALQAIERELAPFHAEDPDSRTWPTPEGRAECARQAEDCRQLLAEVMQLEKQNEERITVRRDEVASQLQTAHAASVARGAYQAQNQRNVPKPKMATGTDDPQGSISPLASQPQGSLLDIQSEAAS